MTKVNPNNGNETKSGIFPWSIFKSDIISFLSKNIKAFQWLSKSKFLSFMAKVSPNNENETKSGTVSWDTFFHLTPFFIGRNIWHLSLSLQK